jgi:hypothetical protein
MSWTVCMVSWTRHMVVDYSPLWTSSHVWSKGSPKFGLTNVFVHGTSLCESHQRLVWVVVRWRWASDTEEQRLCVELDIW